MSKKLIPIVISITTSALIGYGFYAFYKGEIGTPLHLTTSIVAFVFSLIMLISSFGVEYETERIKVIVNFIGSTFLVLGVVLLSVIMLFSESFPWLIIPMGLLLMVYLSAIHFVSKSGQ